MFKRISLVALFATFLAGFTLTAVALGRTPARAARTIRLASVQPDQVVQWNQELQKVLVAPGAQPPAVHPTRTMAITQIAVYDAVNGILGGRRSLLVDLRGPSNASPDAAVAAAARTTLIALLPAQRSEIESFYRSSLARLGGGPSVRQGIRFGNHIAQRVLAARAHDKSLAPPPEFTPVPGPGNYQLTPPSFTPAGFTQTRNVTPFVLTRANRFRPAAPPVLTSARYAADFNEVKSVGELNSATRTPDQTDIGRFWGAAPIWIVWNQVADRAAMHFGTSLKANARLFAQLDVSLADGAIALYDAKYTYQRWRPITAITAPDQGNPNTTADPNWVPLANTANDPSYPGAHAEFSQAAATVLQHAFGTDVFTFSLDNATVGLTRSFGSFSQAANEASASRIYAGQHFRYEEEAGTTLGAQVADFVLEHAFQPVPVM